MVGNGVDSAPADGGRARRGRPGGLLQQPQLIHEQRPADEIVAPHFCTTH